MNHLNASCMMDLIAWFKILLASHFTSKYIDLQGSSQSSFFLPLIDACRAWQGEHSTRVGTWHDSHTKILMLWDKTKVETSKLKKPSLKLFSRDHRVTTSKASNYSTCKSWNLNWKKMHWGSPPSTRPSSVPSSRCTLVCLIEKATHCVLGPWSFRIPWDDKLASTFGRSWESMHHDTSPQRQ